jgi:tetratricopeptide (TPR) repeat protein
MLYAPTLGLCLAVGAGFVSLAERIPRSWIGWALFSALVLGNAVAVLARSADWASSRTLFAADVERMPDSVVVQNNAAWAAAQIGDWATAEEHARRDVALAPSYVDAHATLALLFARSGRQREAMAERDAAAAYDPTVARHVARVRILSGIGDVAGARRAIEDGFGLDPDHPVLLELKSGLQPTPR